MMRRLTSIPLQMSSIHQTMEWHHLFLHTYLETQPTVPFLLAPLGHDKPLLLIGDMLEMLSMDYAVQEVQPCQNLPTGQKDVDDYMEQWLHFITL